MGDGVRGNEREATLGETRGGKYLGGQPSPERRDPVVDRDPAETTICRRDR